MKCVLDVGAFAPEKAHESDAGYDLKSPVCTVIGAHEAVKIDTGVHIQLPPKTGGMVKSRSSMFINHDITTEGVVDAGYTGSIAVKLFNHSNKEYIVKRGDKIAQLVPVVIITPEIEVVDSLEETERGDGGFGSTGR